jgi:hypothetical protein
MKGAVQHVIVHVWWNFEDILSIFALGLFSFFKLVFEALEI